MTITLSGGDYGGQTITWPSGGWFNPQPKPEVILSGPEDAPVESPTGSCYRLSGDVAVFIGMR